MSRHPFERTNADNLSGCWSVEPKEIVLFSDPANAQLQPRRFTIALGAVGCKRRLGASCFPDWHNLFLRIPLVIGQ